MAIERERKFLIKSDFWKASNPKAVLYIQGYLSTSSTPNVLHLDVGQDTATLSIKNSEFNYPIPLQDAREILDILCVRESNTVRVRMEGDKAKLTIKGPRLENDKDAQPEFEYDIPANDAQTMLDTLCEGRVLQKYRHKIEHKGYTWEVDEFLDKNKGLVMAEVEFEEKDAHIPLPEWVDAKDEVTQDKRFSNASLSVTPYSTWN